MAMGDAVMLCIDLGMINQDINCGSNSIQNIKCGDLACIGHYNLRNCRIPFKIYYRKDIK